MNGWRRFRLVYGLWNGHHCVSLSHEGGRNWGCLYQPLTLRLGDFGLIGATLSISPLPVAHFKYDEWLCKLEIWIQHVQPSPHSVFWVAGGDNFGSRPLYISHQDGVFLDWFRNFTASQPFISLTISIMMIGQSWDWMVTLNRVTRTCFGSLLGLKLAWPVFHFWHQDWVSLDGFGQSTACHPLQCLIVSMMNGCARLRFEINMYYHQHTPDFELWVATISAPVPYVSHQYGVCLDWLWNFIASHPFQPLIISMMNGWRRLRLLHGL